MAIDGARVAKRYGAAVTILYRRRVQDMPADWEEIEGATDEDIIILPLAITVSIQKDDTDRVKSIEYLLSEMVPDEKGGRPKPVAIEGSNTILEATAIMAAIG